MISYQSLCARQALRGDMSHVELMAIKIKKRNEVYYKYIERTYKSD